MSVYKVINYVVWKNKKNCNNAIFLLMLEKIICNHTTFYRL